MCATNACRYETKDKLPMADVPDLQQRLASAVESGGGSCEPSCCGGEKRAEYEPLGLSSGP